MLSVTFQPMMSLEGWFVLPSQISSPLDLHRAGFGFGSGFVFHITGKPMSIMEWQAQHAFAEVPEMSLKQMCVELGAEPDDLGQTSGCKYDDLLALRLIMLQTPDLSAEQAKTMLLRRNMVQDLTGSAYLDDADDDYWNDVVLLGDQKDAKVVVAEKKNASERRNTAITSVSKLVETTFPEVQALGKKVATKRAQAKAAAARQQAGQRLYDDLSEDVHRAVLDRLPDEAKVIADRPNGRWFVSYPGFKTRSVSWTQRGSEAAAAMVLEIVWAWHCTATGAPKPDFLPAASSPPAGPGTAPPK